MTIGYVNKALNTLKEFCGQTTCDKCPFCVNEECYLSSHIPAMYKELPSVPLTIKEELYYDFPRICTVLTLPSTDKKCSLYDAYKEPSEAKQDAWARIVALSDKYKGSTPTVTGHSCYYFSARFDFTYKDYKCAAVFTQYSTSVYIQGAKIE